MVSFFPIGVLSCSDIRASSTTAGGIYTTAQVVLALEILGLSPQAHVSAQCFYGKKKMRPSLSEGLLMRKGTYWSHSSTPLPMMGHGTGVIIDRSSRLTLRRCPMQIHSLKPAQTILLYGNLGHPLVEQNPRVLVFPLMATFRRE